MASVPARWPSVAAVPLLFILTVALQIKLGAYSSEFDYDEASHYVTGLYVHDYLTRALGRSPLAFLREFHSHYPLVGLGHWGPAQYVVEGVWMLAFGASRASVLLFSAAITTATASLILLTGLRLGLPLVIAGLAAGAFVASPIIQQGSDSLMLDNTIALTSLLAANAYQAFLERGTWRAAISFALWATVGALVKGNALCLALLPPFALLIGRQWELVRQRAFWLPVAIVGFIAGPWYALTYQLVSPGFRYAWGWDYMSVAIPANSLILAHAFGPLILPLGLMGLALVMAAPRAERQSWLAIAALFLAAFLFQIIVPAAIQDRISPPRCRLCCCSRAWHSHG